MKRTWWALGITVVAVTAFLSVPRAGSQPAVAIGPTDLTGVVTSANGPEAGVWVLAETTDLPTRFAKIVVTDDQGRYVLPELPTATYRVWVRGYGLVDSPRVTATPGSRSTCGRSWPPAPPRRPSTTRPSTGTRC